MIDIDKFIAALNQIAKPFAPTQPMITPISPDDKMLAEFEAKTEPSCKLEKLCYPSSMLQQGDKACFAFLLSSHHYFPSMIIAKLYDLFRKHRLTTSLNYQHSFLRNLEKLSDADMNHILTEFEKGCAYYQKNFLIRKQALEKVFRTSPVNKIDYGHISHNNYGWRVGFSEPSSQEMKNDGEQHQDSKLTVLKAIGRNHEWDGWDASPSLIVCLMHFGIQIFGCGTIDIQDRKERVIIGGGGAFHFGTDFTSRLRALESILTGAVIIHSSGLAEPEFNLDKAIRSALQQQPPISALVFSEDVTQEAIEKHLTAESVAQIHALIVKHPRIAILDPRLLHALQNIAATAEKTNLRAIRECLINNLTGIFNQHSVAWAHASICISLAAATNKPLDKSAQKNAAEAANKLATFLDEMPELSTFNFAYTWQRNATSTTPKQFIWQESNTKHFAGTQFFVNAVKQKAEQRAPQPIDPEVNEYLTHGFC